jgi:hypothetical protein
VARIYTLLFSHPAVAAITWWDFADRNAWQRAPAGLVGQDLRPKPAYTALQDLVKHQWWTRAELTTDAEGRVAFRGFLGDYKLTVRSASGKDIEATYVLNKDPGDVTQIVVDGENLP